MFGVGLMKGLLLLVVAAILLALSFIPIVNLAAGFLGLMILAYDSVDYSLEAKGLGLKERWQFACARRVELAGMALALSLTLLIPGLTVLLQPIGVAGAVRGARVLERESAEKSA